MTVQMVYTDKCICFHSKISIVLQAFEDHHTLAAILVQLAILGLAESNWGQAITLLLEAQVGMTFIMMMMWW